MTEIRLASDLYIVGDVNNRFLSGEAFHQEFNEHGRGSVSTPIARFFVSDPAIGAEGFHLHQRLDCFVRRHPLSPKPETLGLKIADALIAEGTLAEPVWISWHVSEEVAGTARGEVFDYD